jgi:hypothetical protein
MARLREVQGSRGEAEGAGGRYRKRWPPPHYHKSEREFFLIRKGNLDVMTDGPWNAMLAGGFVELPPNIVHTPSDQESRSPSIAPRTQTWRQDD